MCASHCRLDRAGQTTGHMSLSGAKGSWCRSRWSGRGAKKATIDRPGCQLPLFATSLKVANGAKVKALWLWADLGGDRKNKDMGFYCLDLAVTRKVTLDKFSFIFKPTFSQENRTNMSWSLQMMSPYEAVSDQGPVWVRSEDKIPSGFESTPNIIFSMPRYSLVTQLSEKVWHVYSQN